MKARLAEDFSVDDLKLAVDGCVGNTFNIEHGFVDLELICRDDQHVVQYTQWARRNGTPGARNMTAAEVAAWDAE